MLSSIRRNWGLTIAYCLIVAVGALGLYSVDQERERAVAEECVLRNEDRHAIIAWIESTTERIEETNKANYASQTEEQRLQAQENLDDAQTFSASLSEALPILPCEEE